MNVLLHSFLGGLFSLALVAPVTAQLTLTASDPADGATDVPTTATVAFTFSEALDTGVVFVNDDDLLGDYYLGVDLNPLPLALLGTRISADGRTASIDLLLEDNTQYLVMLNAARSTTGTFLGQPAEFNFSTGSTLPAGTVSGTVTFDGGDPTGAMVGVFPATGPLDENDAIAATIITEASGAYSVNFVPEGDFFVGAFKNLNEDALPTDPYADALGLYDGDGDQLIDPVPVGAGASVNNIDLLIRVLPGQTARGPFPTAEAFARSLLPDAQLGLISTEVDEHGEGPAWIYLFYSPAQDDTVSVVVFGDQFTLSQEFVEEEDDEFPFDLATPFPDGWIDSEVALDSAEANGGAAFRAIHPDARIAALLANATCDPGGTLAGKGLWNGRVPLSLAGDAQRQTTHWFVLYFSEATFVSPLFLCIDAATGAVVPTPVEADPGLPTGFVLEQNYPNPFHHTTHLSFHLPHTTPVRLVLYNVLGQEVATLVEGLLPAGYHTLTWHADDQPAGLYVYRLTAGTETRSRAMLRHR
jgi:hypothetical protein